MGVNTCLWSELLHSNDQLKVSAILIRAKFIACELWTERVGTSAVVLYRNQ